MVKIKEMEDEEVSKPTNMFWGVTLDAGKKYSQVVRQSFHLSMAALENNAGSKSPYVQVMLQQDSQEYLLCTLQHDKLLQQPLDLLFRTGEELAFSLNGTGVVHLTGYLSPEVDDTEFEEDEIEDPDFTLEDGMESSEEEEEEEEDEEDEAPELVSPKAAVAGAKRKAKELPSGSKRLKLLNYSTGDDDEDDDEDDDDDELEFSDDFDDSDFSEDVEDEEEEEAEESPVKQNKFKSATPAKAKNEAQTPSKKVKTPKQEGKTPQKGTPKAKGKTPQSKEETESPAATPSGNGESAKKKKKKKKKNKNEGDADSSMVSDGGDTPKGQQQQQQTPKKRVIAGGTVVQDVKVGHGPEAKPGKMVSVYYVGTLAKNNKRFDSCEKGKPFRFRLNQGEVIKGWDFGVQGMKVGGKRKLLIPASQAYGNMKQGPIPANSALQFEVELKAVS